jgi:hypothetical protein
MEHLLILTQDDIIEYATKLLALRGVRPAAPIAFEPVKGQKGAFKAVITCVSADFPDHCPQCGHALGQAPDVEPSARAKPEPESAPVQSAPTAAPVRAVAPAMALDAELGESLDPPGPSESGARSTLTSGSNEDAEGMSALVAQSRRLEAQLNRERKDRKPR